MEQLMAQEGFASLADEMGLAKEKCRALKGQAEAVHEIEIRDNFTWLFRHDELDEIEGYIAKLHEQGLSYSRATLMMEKLAEGQTELVGSTIKFLQARMEALESLALVFEKSEEAARG